MLINYDEFNLGFDFVTRDIMMMEIERDPKPILPQRILDGRVYTQTYSRLLGDDLLYHKFVNERFMDRLFLTKKVVGDHSLDLVKQHFDLDRLYASKNYSHFFPEVKIQAFQSYLCKFASLSFRHFIFKKCLMAIREAFWFFNIHFLTNIHNLTQLGVLHGSFLISLPNRELYININMFRLRFFSFYKHILDLWPYYFFIRRFISRLLTLYFILFFVKKEPNDCYRIRAKFRFRLLKRIIFKIFFHKYDYDLSRPPFDKQFFFDIIHVFVSFCYGRKSRESVHIDFEKFRSPVTIFNQFGIIGNIPKPPSYQKLYKKAFVPFFDFITKYPEFYMYYAKINNIFKFLHLHFIHRKTKFLKLYFCLSYRGSFKDNFEKFRFYETFRGVWPKFDFSSCFFILYKRGLNKTVFDYLQKRLYNKPFGQNIGLNTFTRLPYVPLYRLRRTYSPQLTYNNYYKHYNLMVRAQNYMIKNGAKSKALKILDEALVHFKINLGKTISSRALFGCILALRPYGIGSYFLSEGKSVFYFRPARRYVSFSQSFRTFLADVKTRKTGLRGDIDWSLPLAFMCEMYDVLSNNTRCISLRRFSAHNIVLSRMRFVQQPRNRNQLVTLENASAMDDLYSSAERPLQVFGSGTKSHSLFGDILETNKYRSSRIGYRTGSEVNRNAKNVRKAKSSGKEKNTKTKTKKKTKTFN
jgi:hypothetical protein